ncbi:MAG: phosphatase PAP2 family protein [Firmicutes bacterium]|nr:phosphatase PAP2 family protein [Bacillota bacterium]
MKHATGSTYNRVIITTDLILTRTVYLIYPALLIYLAVKKEPALLQALLVPGISFVLVSIFRYFLNAPRPYEVTGKEPIIQRKGTGKSFPSRHTFSTFVIAVTVFYFWPPAGILTGIAGAVLATVRVLGGVHFVRDVIAGAVIGIGCGVIGFYLI